MSLGRLLRRASSKASDLLTFNPGAGGSSARSGLDGEIIFSKNNVCVHPAEPLPGLGEHHPGTLLPLCPPPPPFREAYRGGGSVRSSMCHASPNKCSCLTTAGDI